MLFFTETQVHALTYAPKQAPPLPFPFDVEIKVDVCTKPPKASLLTYLFMSNFLESKPYFRMCDCKISTYFPFYPCMDFQALLDNSCDKMSEISPTGLTLLLINLKNQRSGSQRECKTGRSRGRCVRGGGGMKKWSRE